LKVVISCASKTSIESHPKAQPLTKIKGNRVKNKIAQRRTAKCASARRAQVPKRVIPLARVLNPEGETTLTAENRPTNVERERNTQRI